MMSSNRLKESSDGGSDNIEELGVEQRARSVQVKQRAMSVLHRFKGSAAAGLAGNATTHAVLVLDRDSFRLKTPETESLIKEVRSWLAARKQVLVVRLADEEAGGCDAAQMLASTPDELIGAGLYHREPMAWYEGMYKDVCFSRLAAALGAKELKADRFSVFRSFRSHKESGRWGTNAKARWSTNAEVPHGPKSPPKAPLPTKARAESTLATEAL
jgi:hypothetical protein